MKNNVADIYELTPLQQGMLYHTLSTPQSAVYNMQMDYALEGELDVDALEQSWKLILDRHDVLRTAFVWAGVAKPYQVVHRSSQLNIAQYDWRGMPASEQQQKILSFVTEDRARAFDLSKPGLIRLSLITRDETHYRFVWTFHHIILEGWSAAILAGEFWKAYHELRSQRSPGLPPVRRYAEYISWLKQQDQAKAEAYWREKLKDFKAASVLPIDKAATGEEAQVVNVDVYRDELTQEQTRALRELARKNRVTLNTVVQGLWAVLLGRYTGETDILFGAALSGRPPDLSGAESIVGLFVNVLPVRVEISPDEPVFSWLQQLQLDQAVMRQYEYSSLMQVKSWSELPGGQPLFQTVLGFENWLGDLPSGPVSSDLKITSLETVTDSDQPLTLFATTGSTVSLTLMYDTERFEGNSVEQMLMHFRVLLEGILADPERRISELPVLGDAERRQILIEWNDTTTAYPRDKTVHELFEARAAAMPDTIAVDYDGEQLSYLQLNTKANRLAHYLRAIGVGPEVMAGIMLERSPKMVVALLAVLKAGGAYVPLDLDYPKPRLGFMLEDAGAPVLLTSSNLRDQWPEFAGKIICLDTDWAEIEQQSTANPAVTATAENLAYVIYTSGSTGKPKGVLVPHRAINRLVCNTNYFQVVAGDRVAQASNVSFDAATFELWGALLNGARLIGISKEVLLNPQSFSRFMNEHDISTLFITTALFNLVARTEPTAFHKLRGLMFGGEAVDPKSVRRILDSGAPEQLLHVYGPTESTTFASWYHIDNVPADAVTIPIGRPLANTQLYVLDSAMNPLPAGVSGELYIGGDGLARGYLNRADLTAEKFVANPFSTVSGACLYRTGDRVCLRGDGTIEFQGRFDHQVKIRGFRIEPGEVESLLAEYPDISTATVIVSDDADKGKRLLAYAIPAGGSDPIETDVREYLRQRLPEYMIPARIVWLDEFPLTPNGKIDHSALPAPAAVHKPGTVSNRPETEMEVIMARIWEKVLDIDDIETNDMFFDLGGHSLLSIKVVEMFAEETGIRLSPLSLLNQTLRQLVAAIEPSAQASNKVSGKGMTGS